MQTVFRVFEAIYPDSLDELNLAIHERQLIKQKAQRELKKMEEEWRNEE